MKKSLLAFLTLPALMLASCSNEEVMNAASGDGYVTFTAQLPGEFSRSYSDGQTATQLTYAVYEENSTTPVIKSRDAGAPSATFTDKQATLSLNLVKGKTYDIVFWADKSGNTFYEFDADTQSINVKYDGIESCDEGRDAFFQVEKSLEVTGNLQKTITLRRPFAQINFLTDDYDAAKAIGMTATRTALKVTSPVYQTLNLVSGVASNPKSDGLTFDYAALPASSENNPLTDETLAAKYKTYLSMNYVLTGSVVSDADDVQKADKELIDCEFSVQDQNGNEVNTIMLSNLPVQRNYRTNIFGSLLTSTIDYNIVIDEIYNDPAYDVEYVEVSTANELINALGKEDANVVIEKDVTISLPELTSPIELKNNSTLTVNGTIESAEKGGIFTVPEGTKATIEGEGTVIFNYAGDRTIDGSSHAVRALEISGEAVVNNLSFECPNHTGGNAIYVNTGGTATLTDVKVNTGFRALTTDPGTTVTIRGGEFHSTSSNQYKDREGNSVWAYCVVIGGTDSESLLEDVVITGIQGGISVEKNARLTLRRCDISTANSPGKTDAYHAVYTAQSGDVLIEDGKYYSPRQAIYAGNNDIQGDTYGTASIHGGLFSSKGYDEATQTDLQLEDGYEWQDNTDVDTKDRYPFTVVKTSADVQP